ncbi:hypothetical protein, partial [Brucella intermedia]|uniref:hypothetical protein n=1 Tax=Brucella intermedia TaxID=94625 RepID=UPI0005BCA08F
INGRRSSLSRTSAKMSIIIRLMHKREPELKEILIGAATTITQFIGDRRSCQMPEPPEFS